MNSDITTIPTTSLFHRFWASVKEALLQMVTGRDNRTHDPGRWMWWASFMSLVGHAWWSLYHGATVDLEAHARSLAILAAGFAAALKLKETTEPPIPPPGGAQ